MTDRFTVGSVWSNGATPPATKILTTGYVVGDEIFITRENELTIEAVISGTAPVSVDFQLEQSMDGSDWAIVDRLENKGTLSGSVTTHVTRQALTKNAFYRISAKRTGGDGTTSLLAMGYTRLFGGRDGH